MLYNAAVLTMSIKAAPLNDLENNKLTGNV